MVGGGDPLQDPRRTVVLVVLVVVLYDDGGIEYVGHQLFPSLSSILVGVMEDVCCFNAAKAAVAATGL